MHDRKGHPAGYYQASPIDPNHADRLTRLAFPDPHAEITPAILETVEEIIREMDELDLQEYGGPSTRGCCHDHR